MIARIWHGAAEGGQAEAYRRHFATRVVPHLKELAGHQGAYLLERAVGGEVEFTAVTLWESMDRILAFTGPDPSVAIVEPAARAVLVRFDEFATHYEAASFPVGSASVP